jgi:hypothetical protein
VWAVMDHFSSLPTPLLSIIHRLVCQAGGLRAALSLESSSKHLSQLLRENARLEEQAVVTDADLDVIPRARSMWLFLATHGHRLGSILFDVAYGTLPPLCAQKGVGRAPEVGVRFAAEGQSLDRLADLPNLHHLCCDNAAHASNMELLPSLTTLQSCELANCPIDCPESSRIAPGSLVSLTALTHLQLWHVDTVSSLDFLQCLATNLRSLELGGLVGFPTLDPISSLRQLQSLVLANSFNCYNQLAPLGALQDLQRLTLMHVGSVGIGQQHHDVTTTWLTCDPSASWRPCAPCT